MKKLFFFLVVLLFMAACQKDEYSETISFTEGTMWLYPGEYASAGNLFAPPRVVVWQNSALWAPPINNYQTGFQSDFDNDHLALSWPGGGVIKLKKVPGLLYKDYGAAMPYNDELHIFNGLFLDMERNLLFAIDSRRWTLKILNLYTEELSVATSPNFIAKSAGGPYLTFFYKGAPYRLVSRPYYEPMSGRYVMESVLSGGNEVVATLYLVDDKQNY